MTEIDILTKQTEGAYEWTNKLIRSIAFDKWETIPAVVESSISWQVGHLIMSHYFHSVMVIVGHQPDIIQKIPLKEYDGLFTNALPENATGKTNPQDLLNHLAVVQQKSINIISALTPSQLEEKLVATPTPHPIAKTKFEAIDWNIKHTMYHCGQIGMLKRIIDERYDFGLRKSD
ncbi:DinB family protein [Runella sp.]|uniref:DinB family protein n=1 Tax=Runella sp. TaxID=1960881 RepID=UPI003D10D286